MTSSITKQAIDAMAARAHRTADAQHELVDDRESGLRIRASQRAVTWSLLVRLRTGKRTRVTLGAWPAMSIADARKAAQHHRQKVLDGVDPNAERQAVAEDCSANRKTV